MLKGWQYCRRPHRHRGRYVTSSISTPPSPAVRR
jgi:hypothetical protein